METPLWLGFWGVVGCVMGSFLNVVVYRLPLMLQRQEQRYCQQLLHNISPKKATERFDLALPASHCPQCQQSLTWRQNIPLLSYLWQQGRCHCPQKKAIPARYFWLELICGLVTLLTAATFHDPFLLLPALAFSWILLAASAIDLEHQILPDLLILPGLWLGLICSLVPIFVGSQTAIIGALAGYLSLWLLYQGFLQLTGRQGMGHGDFKCLAMIGAWVGWLLLPLVCLLAASGGLIAALSRGEKRREAIPFGPCLALGGWVALLWGPPILNWLYG